MAQGGALFYGIRRGFGGNRAIAVMGALVLWVDWPARRYGRPKMWL